MELAVAWSLGLYAIVRSSSRRNHEKVFMRGVAQQSVELMSPKSLKKLGLTRDRFDCAWPWGELAGRWALLPTRLRR